MKKILFLIVLIIAMTSCSMNDGSYSYKEVMSLIAVDAATPTDTGFLVAGLTLQVVVIDATPYYPEELADGSIRYYPVIIWSDHLEDVK